ncbi:hypothetical protein BKA70DRAFT_1402812 [Coprinopsis sp. MPI-PUGE-AT-0042]|nr:hypothetical protein BKA70DRAFT_1402812 [Coprinopsis sp. MPI-PUGE-AT-0042]
MTPAFKTTMAPALAQSSAPRPEEATETATGMTRRQLRKELAPTVICSGLELPCIPPRILLIPVNLSCPSTYCAYSEGQKRHLPLRPPTQSSGFPVIRGLGTTPYKIATTNYATLRSPYRYARDTYAQT